MLLTFDLATASLGFALAWAVEGLEAEPSIGVLTDPLAALPGWPLRSDVALWVGTLAPAADLATFARLAGLSETEQAQLSCFRRREDAAAYAAAHGALRLILGKMLQSPPERLHFWEGPRGKPFLHPPSGSRPEPIQFNISHSGGRAAISLARNAVGVDIERMRWSDDLLDVARSNFSEELQTSLLSASGERWATLFYRYWTLGEAFIKATGEGMSQGLDAFAFTSDGQPRLTRVAKEWGPTERWQFGSLHTLL